VFGLYYVELKLVGDSSGNRSSFMSIANSPRACLFSLATLDWEDATERPYFDWVEAQTSCFSGIFAILSN